MKQLFVVIFLLPFPFLWADILHVPVEYASIQSGIDAAFDGDTILVANGTYTEQLLISGKSITLASTYMQTQNQNDITATIIDGDDDDYVIFIENSAGNGTSIHGLTIQNGDDGIYPEVPFNIEHCIIQNCTDGIDYESGSGGVCKNNRFENNIDDGIDLDDDVDIIIENNEIVNNHDDGIEVRLQNYSGPVLNIIISNNLIENNDEDGIQFIDYPDLSDRIFRVENNLIINNIMAGIGCIDAGLTDNYEFYQGAAIPEKIYLVNNTISGNDYGVTGGANLTSFNNIIANNTTAAMKNVNGNSIISYSVLWNNGQDFDNCITDDASLILADPQFISDSDYHLQEGSPCIEAGTADDSPLSDIEYSQRGNPPDIGAYENISEEDQALPAELSYFRAEYKNGRVEIIWSTESETNNLGYEIFFKDSEENEWRMLSGYKTNSGLIGLGTSSFGKNYSYIHQNIRYGLTFFYLLKQYDYSGYIHVNGSASVDIPNTPEIPTDYYLAQNFPNPFNPQTTIKYLLKKAGPVKITIYDSMGRKVKELINKRQQAGQYYVDWNAGNLNNQDVVSGLYYYRIETETFTAIKKMIYLK